MNKVRTLKIGTAIALAAIAASAIFASSAVAFPTKTTPCTGCHSGANVPVTATLVSVTAASATYNVSAPTADAIAVFSGSTRLFVFSATSGSFSVAPGKTYSVLAVAGPSTGDGIGSTSVSPVAPVVDSTAPVTTSDAKATYVSSAAIKLTATDVGSGVAATYYRLDGGAQVAGTSINLTTVGAHTLQFWSVDVAGNVELFKTAAFTITAPVPVDSTAPVTTSDAKATYVSSAAIKLTATDAGSGVAATYYKLDGAAQVAGTSINLTTVGSHSLEFWSVDVAGNIETHKTAAFTITAPVPVDSTAPVTTSDAVATYLSLASIKLTATDAGSGVAATYYKLDGGAQVAGTSINLTVPGAHSVEFWSVDVAGNIETHKTATFSITTPPPPADTTAPVTSSDAKSSYVSSAAIKLTATDAGSGVAWTFYRLDGGADTAGTSIATTTLGSHTIEFWSVDVAGNAESPKTASFTITAPPVPPVPPVYSQSSLTISANARKVKFRKSVSLSGALTPGGAGKAIKVYAKAPGSKSWKLIAVRDAGAANGSGASGWSQSYKLSKKGTYRFRAAYSGDASSSAADSAVVSVVSR